MVTATGQGTTTVHLQAHPDDERLAILRIDRPPVNAFNQQMWDALLEVAQRLHGPTTFRAVVLTGGGRNFAAGADVKELADLTTDQFDERNRILQKAFHLIATAPQITVAAVNGYALGGGCELALAADFRYSGRKAVFGLPEVTLGIIPGSGGTRRLPRIVGTSRAKDLIYTGRLVDADEALAIGLIDRLLDDEAVYQTAVDAALTFARGPLALQLAKRAIDVGAALPIEEGLALEADLITQCFDSIDGRIGLRSFVENGPRKAAFTGR